MISSLDAAVLLFKKWLSERTVLRVMLSLPNGRAVVTCPAQIVSVSSVSVGFSWGTANGGPVTEGSVLLADAPFGWSTPADVPPPLKKLAEESIDNFLVVAWSDEASIAFIEHKD
jgi:hypothetical protein